METLLFRKKPVVIEAVQLTLENSSDVKEWCGGRTWSRAPMRAITGISIPTLEGVMNAEYGDWIIKGVKGEFYPCKPEIFAATYEPANALPESVAGEARKICDKCGEYEEDCLCLDKCYPPAPTTPDLQEELERVKGELADSNRVVSRLREEREELKASRDKAQADAAAMREFLEEHAYCEQDCSSGQGGYVRGRPKGNEVPCRRCEALSTDAGRDFINQRETMRTALLEFGNPNHWRFDTTDRGVKIVWIGETGDPALLARKALSGPPSEYVTLSEHNRLKAELEAVKDQAVREIGEHYEPHNEAVRTLHEVGLVPKADFDRLKVLADGMRDAITIYIEDRSCNNTGMKAALAAYSNPSAGESKQ